MFTEPCRTVLDLIKRRMGMQGWTQANLARATGISAGELSEIFNFRRPLKSRHLFVLDNILNLRLNFSYLYFTDPKDDQTQSVEEEDYV